MFYAILNNGQAVPIEKACLRHEGIHMEAFGDATLSSNNTLSLQRLGNFSLQFDQRFFHGSICNYSYLGQIYDRHIYNVSFQSQLYLAKQAKHNAVFKNKTLKEICTLLLNQISFIFHDILDQPIPLLIQYEQSDFDFFIETLDRFQYQYAYIYKTKRTEVHIFKKLPTLYKKASLENRPFNTGAHSHSCIFHSKKIITENEQRSTLKTTEPNLQVTQSISCGNETLFVESINHYINSLNESMHYWNEINNEAVKYCHRARQTKSLTATSLGGNQLRLDFGEAFTAPILTPGNICFAAKPNSTLICSFLENDLAQPIILGATNTESPVVANENSYQYIFQSNENLNITLDEKHHLIQCNNDKNKLSLTQKSIAWRANNAINIHCQTLDSQSNETAFFAKNLLLKTTLLHLQTKNFRMEAKQRISFNFQKINTHCSSYSASSKYQMRITGKQHSIKSTTLKVHAAEGQIHTQKYFQCRADRIDFLTPLTRTQIKPSRLTLSAPIIDLQADRIIMGELTYL